MGDAMRWGAAANAKEREGGERRGECTRQSHEPKGAQTAGPDQAIKGELNVVCKRTLCGEGDTPLGQGRHAAATRGVSGVAKSRLPSKIKEKGGKRGTKKDL